jgi:hypothetical protein
MPPGDKKKKVTNQQASSKMQSFLSNRNPTFHKSKTKKYPYLGSQFQFDSKVFNPMKNNGPTQRSYTYSVNDGTGLSRQGSETKYNEAKYKQDMSLKLYFGGNRAQRKSAEKGARRAAEISSSMLKGMYNASKLLAQGKENEADALAHSTRMEAFNQQKRGGFGSSEVSKRQYRNIQDISNAYYSPRIQQQAKNMTKGIEPIKIKAPDAKEINASLRRLTSKKKK